MGVITCEKCGKQYGDSFVCQNCSQPVYIAQSSGPSQGEAEQLSTGGEGLPGEAKVRFGLRGKLIILVLLVSLIPLSITSFLHYMTTKDRISKEAEALLQQTAEGLAGQVNEWVDKNVRVLRTVAQLPEIISMDSTKQEVVLPMVAKEYPWMYLVFTVDPSGMNVARNDGKPLTDYSDRDYYKDVMAGKPLSWQVVIGKTSKKPALILAVPIKNGDTIVGVMAAAMTLDDIADKVAGWKRGQTGFAFLVDDKNRVVAHPDPALVQSQKAYKDNPLVVAHRSGAMQGVLYYQDVNGEKLIGYTTPVNNKWMLALQQSEPEVLAGLAQATMLGLVVLVSTIVVVVLVAWFSARAVVRPITELTSVAERMSLGDLEATIGVQSQDEIGLLAKAIGRMQMSLRLAMSRLKKK